MEVTVTKSDFYQSTGTEFYRAFRILVGNFSAEQFDQKKFGEILKPCYYCAGLAVELFLKSYLTNKGIETEQNHQSHSLKKLINLDKPGTVRELGLDESDINNLEILNDKYFGEEYLRYDAKGGENMFPNPLHLDKTIGKIENNLQKILLASYLKRSGAYGY